MAAHEHPLTDLEQRLLAIANEHGFILLREPVQYYCELKRDHVIVYLDRQRSARNVIAVFLHPETDLSRLPAEAGLGIPDAPKHSDGMRHFPKKVNKGKRPSTYGYPITCADLTSFGRLLASLT
ncbi:hypothetical protein [Nonomuraea sp. NPDC001831]|uniref:hypothetical protein n=1 Tax=Nonomuraea sp. NPDC001831 TaxID=3364340 RepID=UPI0036750D9C